MHEIINTQLYAIKILNNLNYGELCNYNYIELNYIIQMILYY